MNPQSTQVTAIDDTKLAVRPNKKRAPKNLPFKKRHKRKMDPPPTKLRRAVASYWKADDKNNCNWLEITKLLPSSGPYDYTERYQEPARNKPSSRHPVATTANSKRRVEFLDTDDSLSNYKAPTTKNNAIYAILEAPEVDESQEVEYLMTKMATTTALPVLHSGNNSLPSVTPSPQPVLEHHHCRAAGVPLLPDGDGKESPKKMTPKMAQPTWLRRPHATKAVRHESSSCSSSTTSSSRDTSIVILADNLSRSSSSARSTISSFSGLSGSDDRSTLLEAVQQVVPTFVEAPTTNNNNDDMRYLQQYMPYVDAQGRHFLPRRQPPAAPYRYGRNQK